MDPKEWRRTWAERQEGGAWADSVTVVGTEAVWMVLKYLQQLESLRCRLRVRKIVNMERNGPVSFGIWNDFAQDRMNFRSSSFLMDTFAADWRTFFNCQ